MNPRVLLLIVGSLLLPLGCDGPPGPAVRLEPGEFCSDNSDAAIATFESANLETAIRAALSVGAQEPLTCGLISGLTRLVGSFAGPITSLLGIQNLTSLTNLDLGFNPISDISALSGLTSLTELYLRRDSISDISALSGLTSLIFLVLNDNSITDISVLSGLTSLTCLGLSDNLITDISALSGLTSQTFLSLSDNPTLTDIQPLLDNTGLGAGDEVPLLSTSVSCTDVAALKAKGVTVNSGC